MEISRGVNAFLRFYGRLIATHFFSYVLVGGISYMLIMRQCGRVQFFRGLILAAVLYPLRETVLKIGRRFLAGTMTGLSCLAGYSLMWRERISADEGLQTLATGGTTMGIEVHHGAKL